MTSRSDAKSSAAETGVRWFLAVILATFAASGIEAIAAAEEVDTSQWRCALCPFPSGVTGWIDTQSGYVSADSAKFGEYSDHNDSGVYLSGGADVRLYRDGQRWEFTARDLGLATRFARVEVARQGRYRMGIDYDEIRRHASDSAATPLRGHDTLELPAGWVRAGTTDAMTMLASSLHGEELESRRRRLALDLAFQRSTNWTYEFNFRRERRKGLDAIGGAFLTNSVLLPRPIDYHTREIEAGLRYHADAWQLAFDYRGSMFENASDPLTWDNPFTPITPGADRGRLPGPPDNQAHQLRVSGSSRVGARLFLVGDLALSRMTQDDDFIAPTINTLLVGSGSMGGSADAEVNALTANGRLTYRTPLPRLILTLDYRAVRRDNDTPKRAYTQIVTDNFVSAPRVNQPLSYGRYSTGLRADYRFRARGRLSGGLDYEAYERTVGDDPSTNEYTFWAEYRTPVTSGIEARLKLSGSERRGSNQNPISAALRPQNPRMRWFDIADRSRGTLQASLHASVWERVGISFVAKVDDQSFDDTEIGRTDLQQINYALDVSATPRDNMTLYAYASHASYQSRQRGSERFADTDWIGKTKDRYTGAGLGIKISDIRGKLDLGLDVVFSGAEGDVDVATGRAEPGFPDLRTRRVLTKLSGDYALRERLTLTVELQYERYRSDDWSRDGVFPNTVPRVLTLGDEAPAYDVWAFAGSIRYGL